MFLNGIKYAEVTPNHKNHDKTEIRKFAPNKSLLNLSKVYKTLMYNQIYPYFHKIYLKFQC